MSRSIRINNGRIYEYHTSRGTFGLGPPVTSQVNSSAQLMFPTRSGKSYYQRGDYILGATLNPRQAAMLFEEFSPRKGEEHTWGALLMALMDLDKVQVVKRIEAIHGSGDSAWVVMKPLMVLSDTELLELTTRRGDKVDVQNMQQLRDSFMYASIYHSTKHIIPLSELLIDVISIPIGGAGRTAAKKVIAPIIKRYSIRVLRKLVSMGGSKLGRRVAITVGAKSAQFAASVGILTAKEVTKTYYTEVQKNQLRGRVDPKLAQTIKVDEILQRAIRKAVADHITSVIVDGIESVVPEGKGTGLLPKAAAERITEYVTKKLLSTVLAPVVQIIGAAIMATPVAGDKETYEKALTRELNERMSKHFSQDTLKDLVSGAYSDFTTAPELLFP